MVVDSHCHLNRLSLDAYENNLAHLINAAQQAGVRYFLNVAIDLLTAQEVIDIAHQFEPVYASVGLHPSDVKDYLVTPADFGAFVHQAKVVAIGETGLDYYYNNDFLEQMRESFRVHIEVAKAVKKPLIIHTRNAAIDTIAILKEMDASAVGGVMHCFTETLEIAEAAISLGFYISFSGIITFKNSLELQAVVKQVPLERILIETDAPYLAPVPYRGKSNEPRYVHYVAEKIAELKGLSFEAVAKQTTENFLTLFSIKN